MDFSTFSTQKRRNLRDAATLMSTTSSVVACTTEAFRLRGVKQLVERKKGLHWFASTELQWLATAFISLLGTGSYIWQQQIQLHVKCGKQKDENMDHRPRGRNPQVFLTLQQPTGEEEERKLYGSREKTGREAGFR